MSYSQLNLNLLNFYECDFIRNEGNICKNIAFFSYRMLFPSSYLSAVGFVEIFSCSFFFRLFCPLFPHLHSFFFISTVFSSTPLSIRVISIHLEKVSLLSVLLNARKLYVCIISIFVWWWCQQRSRALHRLSVWVSIWWKWRMLFFFKTWMVNVMFFSFLRWFVRNCKPKIR